MSRILKRIAAGVAIAGVAALLLAAGGYAAGARVNATKSIPVGLYWTSSAPVEKGAYVLFCPPQLGVFDDAKERGYIGAGFCEGGYGYMMKRVLAAKDDAVAVADDGVRVRTASCCPSARRSRPTRPGGRCRATSPTATPSAIPRCCLCRT